MRARRMQVMQAPAPQTTMAWSMPNNESARNGCFPYAISWRTIPSENTSDAGPDTITAGLFW